MSRPMALGLVLLVLFLTSQSEWKPSRTQLDPSSSMVSKQLRIEKHREGVKEKIIMDLMAENKRLEAEKERYRRVLEEMQRRLVACCQVNPHLDSQPADESLLSALVGQGQVMSQSHPLAKRDGTSRRFRQAYEKRFQQQQSLLMHRQAHLLRTGDYGQVSSEPEQRLFASQQDDDALVQRSAMDTTHFIRFRGSDAFAGPSAQPEASAKVEKLEESAPQAAQAASEDSQSSPANPGPEQNASPTQEEGSSLDQPLEQPAKPLLVSVEAQVKVRSSSNDAEEHKESADAADSSLHLGGLGRKAIAEAPK
eukprot:TRINITY_DN32732_c0_g1_i1.p1 TRINITY_DN32732_c0_g1~~TRINITY_DN32732_c0_g1_i1.p1  ORF type:complete len:309 (-),score=19.15 TRINITY_DN32732_c0_g1_i1:174-1100(-)